MRYIHWRDDFSITESFSTGGSPSAVPDRVLIEYFTAKGRSKFVASRDGNRFENCSLSQDGMSLTVYLSLRGHPVGFGRLLRLATVITEDANYPDGLKHTKFPGSLDAVLYLGKSDGPLNMASEIVFDGGGVGGEAVSVSWGSEDAYSVGLTVGGTGKRIVRSSLLPVVAYLGDVVGTVEE